MLHQLKIDTSWFEMKVRGKKRWEIREDDRGFIEGDYIGLNETVAGVETGRFMIERITAVVREAPGLREGFVLLSTEPCSVEKREGTQSIYGCKNRGVNGTEHTRIDELKNASLEELPRWFVDAMEGYITRRHLGTTDSLEGDVLEFITGVAEDEV